MASTKTVDVAWLASTSEIRQVDEMTRGVVGWREVLLVAVGGAVGTLLREGCASVLPTTASGLSWSTIAVNLSGSLLVGVLLESLARRQGGHARHRLLQLTMGTGVLGGFTTYSGLALQTALLLNHGAAAVAAAAALSTVLGGLLMALLGVRLMGPRGAIQAALRHEVIDSDTAVAKESAG